MALNDAMASVGRAASGTRELRADAHQNRERLAAAAVAAIHRDGLHVPMATIAAGAGVGVGTLYRHFPTRDDLLDELTCRSFQRMLDHLTVANNDAGTATESLRQFLTAVITDREDMLLPATGGPAVQTDRTRAVQAELHAAIRQLLQRGVRDGTIRRKVDVWDVAWLGATLAQPGREGQGWDEICLRLLDTYLAGLTIP
jgi:AcrR family transcriptional regulator